jgi:peroxiredoxin
MQDMFVCDLVAVVKVCQIDLFNMYCDQNSKFSANNLWAFKSLLECKDENIQMQWVPDVNTRVCHLTFEVFGQHIWVVHQDLETMVTSFVTKDVFIVVEYLVMNM